MKTILACQQVCIGYDKQVIKGPIDLEIHQGEYVCITGENGSGKSTFVKTLLGLIPLVSGSLKFDMDSGIGYLPQQTQIQKDFPATVQEVVESGLVGKLNRRFFLNSIEKQTVKTNMHLTNVDHLKNESFRNLSGGQQQRVLLARALCAGDDLLILDEPNAGIDPEGTNQMYECIAHLNHHGVTIIMVSHDIHAVKKYATKEIHFSDGVEVKEIQWSNN